MPERESAATAAHPAREPGGEKPPSVGKQLAKAIPTGVGALGAFGTAYSIASSFTGSPFGKIWLTLVICAAGLLLILIAILSRKSFKVPLNLLTVLMIITFGVTVSVAYLISTDKTPAAGPAGAITAPGGGASDVCQNRALNASGTAANIPSGHRLWLFLYVASANNGAGLYYPGDTEPITRADGRWAGGSVFIGGTGQAGQRFTLWLADLGPQGFTDLDVNTAGPSPGFPALRYAPDVTPLGSVTFTTVSCP